MTATSIAVQFVNFRTQAYLERSVASVVADLERSGVSYEVNLLDNASGDDLEPLRDRFAACRVFVADHNLGFGAGHNLLAGKTDARYLFVLNPDVEFFTPDTTKHLLASMDNPGVMMAGPKLVTGEGVAQRWDHGRLHGLRAQISNRGGHSYWRETDTPQDVAWVSGAAMLVDRAAYQSIGGFDEAFFLYKEDEDLCLRMRQAGGLIAYEPTVVVRHSGSVVANRSEELARSTGYFIDKHFAGRRTQRMFAAIDRCLPYLRL